MNLREALLALAILAAAMTWAGYADEVARGHWRDDVNSRWIRKHRKCDAQLGGGWDCDD